jgi:hypothetical protein
MTCNYYQFSIGKSGSDLYTKTNENIGEPKVSFGNGLFEKSVTGCVEVSTTGEFRIFLSGYTYDSDSTTSDNLIYSGDDLEAGIEKFNTEASKKIEGIPEDFFYPLSHIISISMEIGRSDDKEPDVDVEVDEETWRWSSSDNFGEIEIDEDIDYSGALFLQVIPRYDRDPNGFSKKGFASMDEEGREGSNIWIGCYIAN